MRLRAYISLVALVVVLLLSGCHKKKPVLPAPAPPPTVTPPETQPAPTTSAPTAPAPSTTPTPVPSTTTTTKPKPSPSHSRGATAPRHRPPATSTSGGPTQHPATAATAQPTPQPAAPPATPPVAPHATAPQPAPNTTPVQIVPGMPRDQELHARGDAEQLLRATEQNLASIKRQLSADEQEIVQHVRVYMQQSRAATGNGDTTMARNLAFKAHLLSDDLVRP